MTTSQTTGRRGRRVVIALLAVGAGVLIAAVVGVVLFFRSYGDLADIEIPGASGATGASRSPGPRTSR